MTGIRRDALKAPISHIVIVALFAIGGVSIPLDFIFKLFISDALLVKLISETVIRILLSAVAVAFIFVYGFQGALKGRFGLIAVLAVLPALLVVANNFPIIAVITGGVRITATTPQICAYVAYCISVGFYEELVFRGLIFPLCYIVFRKTKQSVFWTVAISSLIFGATHLVNLLGGAGFGTTALQVGYSFLIGAMCAISILITNNILVAVFLHAVYDVGGLLLSFIAVGNQWDTATVIITAVLGVLVATYMTYICFKTSPNKLIDLYRFERENLQEKELDT